MKRGVFYLVLAWLASSIAITSFITIFVFNTPFAHNTIDYFSFAAALYLVVEAIFKICRYRQEPYFPNQIFRHVRIIIGTCVFTIHVMQYIYGV